MLTVAGTIEDTGYHLGLRRQRRGAGDEADEFGGVVAIARAFGVVGADVTVLGEFVHFPDFDGGKESASFLTAATEATLGEFALSAVVGRRKIAGSPAEDLMTATAKYELGDGLSLEIGYRFLEEDGERSHSVGVLVTYEVKLY